jgi:hypothetical protein
MVLQPGKFSPEEDTQYSKGVCRKNIKKICYPCKIPVRGEYTYQACTGLQG